MYGPTTLPPVSRAVLQQLTSADPRHDGEGAGNASPLSTLVAEGQVLGYSLFAFIPLFQCENYSTYYLDKPLRGCIAEATICSTTTTPSNSEPQKKPAHSPLSQLPIVVASTKAFHVFSAVFLLLVASNCVFCFESTLLLGSAHSYSSMKLLTTIPAQDGSPPRRASPVAPQQIQWCTGVDNSRRDFSSLEMSRFTRAVRLHSVRSAK
jgi:hypothetical protein